MPTIPPSQLVAALRALLPAQIRAESHFERSSGLAKIAPLLALFKELPDAQFVLLAPDDRLALHLLAREIEQSIVQWQMESGAGAKRYDLHALKMERVKAFADLLAKCPDEPATVAEKTLAFMPAADKDLSDALLLDISTAHSALANGEFKAAAVMAGSVAEALLLWAVQRVEAKTPGTLAPVVASLAPRSPDADPLRWGLDDFVRAGGSISLGGAPLVSAELAKALDSAREFRNLIHPGRAQRLKVRPTLGGAHLAVGAMRRTVESLEALVVAGKL